MEQSRIAVLTPELADQIAAGEVVERPASVVKELVENAIDAGARRVEVELEQAGLHRIMVRDDGCGIHPDDLPLSLTRHATSKLRMPADLVEVATLGFRGEALASIAAVATITIESRTAARTGIRLHSRPGLPPTIEPVGIAPGTRIEVLRLFANVPARRKFMRSEATEVGHCTDTVLRIALANPAVHLRLRHGNRQLLDLPSADLPTRIGQVLARRSGAKLWTAQGEHEGVTVQAFLAPPEAAVRGGGGLYIIVRRRVVRERALAQAVTLAYDGRLGSGRTPLGCLCVEPPTGTVDVNVHPQKTEVRFSDPQQVYAAVRRVLADLGADAVSGQVSSRTAPAQPGAVIVRAAQQGLRVFARTHDGGAPSIPRAADSPGAAEGGYRLRTAAAGAQYTAHRRDIDRRAAALAVPRQRDSVEASRHAAAGGHAQAANATPEPTAPPSPTLLTCLPGPLALLRHEDSILVVDLKALRSHLMYRRLLQDLGGAGVAAQGLLSPVVIRRAAADVGLCVEHADELEGLGLLLEAFGEDAVIVRAVPAQLRACVEDPDVEDLLERIIAWLRVHRGPQSPAELLQAVASTGGSDPAPRLARRWVAELLDAGADLTKTPGVRRLSLEDLKP